MADQLTNTPSLGAEALKSFQIDNIPIKDKSTSEYGMAICQYISSTVYGGLGSYYFDRNARFAKNRAYANGRIDVKAKFSDRFDYNGKEINYVNIGWQAIQIVNRIISGLVGRFMGRNEKIDIEAKDTLSITEKNKEYESLQFWINQKEKIQKLEQSSGVPLAPKMQDMPQTQDDLLLWKEEFQRLPEEILAEMGCNDILDANGLFDALKEKLLHDSLETGFVGTYTWMDKEGVIHCDRVRPEDAIYSYDENPDFRETSWRGQAPSMKISKIRKDYGVEFGGTLTEKDLWDIAATSKNYQKQDNITWLDQWVNAYMRPYDEWNVDSIQVELKTVDSDKYTVTTTKATSSTILENGLPKTKSGNIRQKPLDNQEVFDDTNWNIYRGVYLPQSKKLLEWGLKKNMIRPQDPKEIGNAEFSYSFYMYQNFKMRNIAVPEKIEQPVDGMILALLKIEQVVAKSRPPGAMINWRGLQNMDFGLGDKKNKEIDIKKLFDQTGDIYYYDLDENDKPIGIPIQEIPNTGFAPAMQAWITTYQFHYQTLRDQLGEDPNLMSQALQPRVTQGNVAASQKESENSTDYMYDAYLYVMEDTAKKSTCLMQKSILFGAEVYRNLMSEEQIKDRIFYASARMLPTEQEIAMLNDRMNATIQSNPDICIYLDTFKALRIAREDVKLAERYYQNCMKKMLESKMQQVAQNAQLNAQSQQQSLQMKAQFDMQQMQTEMQMKGDLSDRESKNKILENLVNGMMQVMAKGIDVQPEWKPLETELINMNLLPLFSQNLQNVGALGGAIKQQQIQLQQQQAEQQQEQQEQQNQSQPQQQAAA